MKANKPHLKLIGGKWFIFINGDNICKDDGNIHLPAVMALVNNKPLFNAYVNERASRRVN